MRRPRATVLALSGAAAVAVFLGLVLRFWHPVYGFTSLLQLDASNDSLKISAFRENPVYVYRDTGGYDGLYYAQIACDPMLASAELPRAMDNFGYRARRILAPALSFALAGGSPFWAIHVYSVLNVAAWLALAAALWKLLPDGREDGAAGPWRKGVAWAGLMFSAGALSSVRLALTDLPAVALLAWSVLAFERGRRGVSLGALAAAGLARETALVSLPALWTRGRGPVRYANLRNLATTLGAAAPLLAWAAYVRWKAGQEIGGWDNFTWPFAAFAGKWRSDIVAVARGGGGLLEVTTILATAGLTVQALYIAAHPRKGESWWRLGAAYAVLLAFLNTGVWEGFPGAAQRALLPLGLAFNVLACRRRAALAWILAGNLSVGAGLLALRDVPGDARELAAARTGGSACVVRAGEGWFGCEHSARHRWSWCGGRGLLEIQAWPRGRARALGLELALHSLGGRTVTITQGGRELWRGAVAARGLLVRIEAALDAEGRAELRFDSDSPAVPEAPDPKARALAFAAYDLKVTPVP